jgi:hypothetical protein
MKWKLYDRVIAKDRFGNFRNEPGKVIGFSTNMLGQPLVIVHLDRGTKTCFYEGELIPEQPKQVASTK